MSEIDAIGQHFAAAREAELKEQMFERRVRAIAREEIEAAGPWVCCACGAVPSPTCPHRGVAVQCGTLVRAAVNQEGGEANSRLIQTGLHESQPTESIPSPISVGETAIRRWQAGYRAAIDALNRATDAEINAGKSKGGEAHSPGRHERPATGLDKSPPAVEAPAAGDNYLGDINKVPAMIELPDDLRVPLHSLQSDLSYLFGRIEEDAAVRNMIEDSVRTRLSHIETAAYRIVNSGTTALARRLAEALNKVWLSGEPEVHEREVESALTEARKRGLIE